ncbi:MAG: hypothetical protein NTV00_03760 [Methylococcales bacterium]|nr:hypothetical protein [Methylococcales bacterium]
MKTKKRISLDSVFDIPIIADQLTEIKKSVIVESEQIQLNNIVERSESTVNYRKSTKQASGNRPDVKQQTAYIPLPVYDQLRRLAFEEERKMHDYLMEGLDLVFKNRGLPAINEITRK